MRMLLTVSFPHEPFNTLVREGTAEEIMRRILEETKPEAVYCTEQEGYRTAVLVVEVEEASQIPSLAEPWFLNFEADCQFRICMTVEELQRAGLEGLGKKWG